MLAEFYSSYYAKHRAAELQQYLHDEALLREMYALEPTSDLRVHTISSFIALRGKRVLDIGFGLGQNLVLMKKLGAEVAGIDLDPDSVSFVHDVLRISNVRQGSPAELPQSPTYDLITLHDVVEHPLDPWMLLNQAKRLLTDGGLCSVWTPNASSVEDEEQPIAFRVDLEHMQYLTFETFRYIARTTGMTIESIGAYGTPRLKNIEFLSGAGGGMKRTGRLLLRSLPGFVQLNRIRKRFTHHNDRSGRYHLHCILRKRD
jgi:2-polyprenyl-3-methyl-5-hydroxy-6-metoxy-1,4-benzoquinol methylase